VLVVDIDPQANATSGLGIDPAWLSRSMYDVFMSNIDGSAEVSIHDIIRKTRSGIDLAPSNLDLVGAEPFFYQVSDRSHLLSRILSDVHNYQFILIDTPPSMGQFLINGLVASDRAIITFDRGIFALNGLRTLMAIFDDIREYSGESIHAEMAILTRVEQPGVHKRWEVLARTLMQVLGMRGGDEYQQEETMFLEIQEEMRKYFRVIYTVPYDRQIAAAQRRGLPISHYNPTSDAAIAYERIAREVMAWG
jgi:chromosome partitioning protein